MSIAKEHNKDLANKVKQTLHKFGYIVQLGHAYELIAVLAGYPNWDTASATGIPLLNSKIVKKVESVVADPTPDNSRLRQSVSDLLMEYILDQEIAEIEEEAFARATEILEDISDNKFDVDTLFILFDCLGLAIRDTALEKLYQLSWDCWGSRVKKEPNYVGEKKIQEILSET